MAALVGLLGFVLFPLGGLLGVLTLRRQGRDWRALAAVAGGIAGTLWLCADWWQGC
ncbi:MAG: hypothetical protein ACOCYP_10005 [Planctomycetota bacterium]